MPWPHVSAPRPLLGGVAPNHRLLRRAHQTVEPTGTYRSAILSTPGTRLDTGSGMPCSDRRCQLVTGYTFDWVPCTPAGSCVRLLPLVSLSNVRRRHECQSGQRFRRRAVDGDD